MLLKAIELIEAQPAYWAAVLFYGFYPILTSLLWMITAIVYHVRRDLKKDAQGEQDYPSVSILIPAYCEEETIERTIEGALAIDYPNFEILVVNDGSRDSTPQKVISYMGDSRLRLIDKRVNEGKAMALNDAILCAHGDLVLIMDADAVPDPLLLKEMVPHFRSSRVGAVAGNPRVCNRRNLLSKLQAVEFSSVIGLMRRAQRIWGRVMCVSGVVGMFRKSALVDVGLFTPGMATEDIDVTWKLQIKSYDVRYEARAKVWMLVPETLGLWWKQRRRWALGLGQVLKRHIRVLGSWKCRQMYPLYIESCLSVLWALCFLGVTVFWCLCYSVGHPPRGGSPIPNLWGMMLFTCALLQLGCGVWIDSRYDHAILHDYPVSILYPSLYWILLATTSCLYTVKGIASKLKLDKPTRWHIEHSYEETAL